MHTDLRDAIRCTGFPVRTVHKAAPCSVDAHVVAEPTLHLWIAKRGVDHSCSPGVGRYPLCQWVNSDLGVDIERELTGAALGDDESVSK